MLYLTGVLSPSVRELVESGRLGAVHTPASGYVHPGGPWLADSGCFGQGYPGDDAYLAWLASRDREGCIMATAPDVVGDHDATVARSAPMIPRIRALGYRVGFVLQDGATVHNVPWADVDAVFIGGTTDWKLGPDVPPLIAAAKARGMWVHAGRVNSGRRYRYMQALGVDSCDGTYLAFGPDQLLPNVLAWTSQLNLFGGSPC